MLIDSEFLTVFSGNKNNALPMIHYMYGDKCCFIWHSWLPSSVIFIKTLFIDDTRTMYKNLISCSRLHGKYCKFVLNYSKYAGMILTSGFFLETEQPWVEMNSQSLKKYEHKYPHEESSVALLLTGLHIVKQTQQASWECENCSGSKLSTPHIKEYVEHSIIKAFICFSVWLVTLFY